MRRFGLAIVLLVTLGLAGAAYACPNCAEAMPGSNSPDGAAGAGGNAGGGGGGGLADGFYWSILFMLAVPYTLAGIGGYAIYRALKKRPTLDAAATPSA